MQGVNIKWINVTQNNLSADMMENYKDEPVFDTFFLRLFNRGLFELFNDFILT